MRTLLAFLSAVTFLNGCLSLWGSSQETGPEWAEGMARESAKRAALCQPLLPTQANEALTPWTGVYVVEEQCLPASIVPDGAGSRYGTLRAGHAQAHEVGSTEYVFRVERNGPALEHHSISRTTGDGENLQREELPCDGHSEYDDLCLGRQGAPPSAFFRDQASCQALHSRNTFDCVQHLHAPETVRALAEEPNKGARRLREWFTPGASFDIMQPDGTCESWNAGPGHLRFKATPPPAHGFFATEHFTDFDVAITSGRAELRGPWEQEVALGAPDPAFPRLSSRACATKLPIEYISDDEVLVGTNVWFRTNSNRCKRHVHDVPRFLPPKGPCANDE